MQTGALCKLHALRTLQMSVYPEVKKFNIPKLLQYNSGLRNLEIEVEKETTLEKEMDGFLPFKLNNITFSGQGLKVLDNDLLDVSKEIFILK